MSSPTSLDFYDAELRAHHEHLRAAYGISPGDEVVDIGCGTGLTTREAARAPAPGRGRVGGGEEPRRRAASSASTCPSACLSAPVKSRRPNGSTMSGTSWATPRCIA